MKIPEPAKVGVSFQKDVLRWFSINYKDQFVEEKKMAIGNPEKLHKFDIVNVNNTIAIECKCYSWTESGNVPSAKMGFCNEAAFYLSFLPDSFEKYIVMNYSVNDKRGETLAEYYFRTNRHLLGNIKVAEYDKASDTMRIVGCNHEKGATCKC